MQTTTSFHARFLFPLLALALLIVSPFLRAAESANATSSTPAPAPQPAAVKTILFFGDSLTAGYGLDDPALAFPGRIQEKITADKLPWRVINAGLSGETTAGGVRRLDWIMRQPVHIFVLELGGNDGLRGIPVSETRTNLQSIIDRAREKHPNIKILLAGMKMPANMGSDYTAQFEKVFADIAKKNKTALVPFVLENVGGKPDLNLPDRIHPTPAGHQIVAQNIWPVLQPLLK